MKIGTNLKMTILFSNGMATVFTNVHYGFWTQGKRGSKFTVEEVFMDPYPNIPKWQ